MIRQIRPALFLLAIFAFLTGILYPLLISGLAQGIFPRQANGSLIIQNGQIVGSELIGQQFTDPKYFWGRPSATTGEPCNASASGGSNYSVLNPKLVQNVKDRIDALQEADPENSQLIPVDLVTSSASGLDPNISLAAAEYQSARVAKARGISLDQVNALIQDYTQKSIMGEKMINVLEINIALDALK